MGYVNMTFAEEMVSAQPRHVKRGLFSHPAAIASMLAVTACGTFFLVKGVLSNDTESLPAVFPPPPVMELSNTQPEATSMTTITTTTTTTTTTTVTTTTTAATTATAAARRADGRFEKAKLLYPAAYPEKKIPGLALPAEFDDGLLDAEAVFWLINQYRLQNGLQPFERADSHLGEAADIRAKELLQDFSQTRPDGSKYETAYDQCGVKYQYKMESAGYGQYTAEHIVSEWIASERNNRNLLDATCTKVYIVCRVGSDNIPVWVLEGIA